MSNLLFFYGQECPHCQRMELLAQKLEGEGYMVERVEIWHNEENVKRMEELDTEPCGGVPFFVNTTTNKTICGEATYEDFKNWAQVN